MRDPLLSTPPPRAPNDRNERRFKKITSPCEWVEDYHPGGYHPVHLGNVFNNQYKVLRKLGKGSYSTVWLARDLKYVALKILVSEISEPTRELQILRHIAESAEGNRHITQLLDEFKHHGPNGSHICLVFEPMGPSANSMVEALPQFNPPNIRMKIRYPPWMAKSILRQSLEALAFLHNNGLAHGDFQPGKILFALDDINSKPEDVFQQEENMTSPPVQRLDGKNDPWAPRYLYIAQPLVSFTPYTKGFKVKLSDMGGAYFFTDPPAKPVTPRGLRAPELVLAGTVDKTLDIWSFGCLLFELVTGEPLFCLGALPDALFRQWKGPSLYFTPERKLFNCRLGGVREGTKPLMVEQKSMEEMFDEAGPDLEEEEARGVKALIRRILQYNPAERPSAAEILRDPWFCEEDLSS
ncbi:serine protein kinase [Schizothecium vesticola]|uniref:non-specific serine/threonine protein kinase n=1 Tax=Schizothecium vesticola TaxID=314040 RepID=A0AA40F2H9_9PEZI|nr:serine protein kinase [Schizothecium vesticola]